MVLGQLVDNSSTEDSLLESVQAGRMDGPVEATAGTGSPGPHKAFIDREIVAHTILPGSLGSVEVGMVVQDVLVNVK